MIRFNSSTEDEGDSELPSGWISISLISRTPGAIYSADEDDLMKTKYCKEETFRKPRKPS